MEAQFIITEYKGRRMGFLLEDGRLVRVKFLESNSMVGDIYTAKVVSKVESINAVFLNIGSSDYLYYSLVDDEDKTIFLKHGKSNRVCIGDEILVQISKDAIKSKKAVATSDIGFRGKYVVVNRTGKIGVSSKITDEEERERLKDVVTPVLDKYSDIKAGVIIRTSAENVSADEICEELEMLLKKVKDIIDSSAHRMAKELVLKHQDSILRYVEELIYKSRYKKLTIITDDQSEYDEIHDVLVEKNSELGDDGVGFTKVTAGLYNYEGIDSDRFAVKLFKDEMTSLDLVFDLETKIIKGFAKHIHLKSGGSIVVEPTEAMTVIDVNTGKAVKGKNVQKTFLKIDKEAAEMIARTIRLRNISGIIVIDFINLTEPEDIKELLDTLKREISRDEIKVNYIDMTPLGLVELTRKKENRPLTMEDFS
ncbi:MAG: ribonuclease E/G [Eubacterium sp.]|nr:ribonuclease E/G [Eubacterium sp.]